MIWRRPVRNRFSLVHFLKSRCFSDGSLFNWRCCLTYHYYFLWIFWINSMEKVEVNLNEIAIKEKSKGELDRGCNWRQDESHAPTWVWYGFHIRDLFREEKGNPYTFLEITDFILQEFFNDEIKICQVPHLKGLRTSHILNFIVKKCKAERYLPSNWYIYPPNRTWLWNIGTALRSLISYSLYSWIWRIRSIDQVSNERKRRAYAWKKPSNYQNRSQNCQNFWEFSKRVLYPSDFLTLFSRKGQVS